MGSAGWPLDRSRPERAGVALYSPAVPPRFNLDRPAPWYHPFHEFAFAMYGDMEALGRTRQRARDDGRIFVVDLDRRP